MYVHFRMERLFSGFVFFFLAFLSAPTMIYHLICDVTIARPSPPFPKPREEIMKKKLYRIATIMNTCICTNRFEYVRSIFNGVKSWLERGKCWRTRTTN